MSVSSAKVNNAVNATNMPSVKNPEPITNGVAAIEHNVTVNSKAVNTVGAAVINATAITNNGYASVDSSQSNNVINNKSVKDPPAEFSKTNLYIRGLSQNTTDKDLINMCSKYGKITSTKAIMDKATNQCRGYGFVDFESDISAETAMKSLMAQGIQAQMAKHQKHDYPPYTSHNKGTQANGVRQMQSEIHSGALVQHDSLGREHTLSPLQEYDPTNLYFANLPVTFKEHDLEHLLMKYGHVVSTRILRDVNNCSKGVGFARMESREKCEKIIRNLNGTCLPGGKDPILVKFADSGPKRRAYKGDIRLWRDTEGKKSGYRYYTTFFQGGPVTCEPTAPIAPNSVTTGAILPAAAIAHYARYAPTQPIAGFSVPAQWIPQYVVHQAAAHIPSVEVVPPPENAMSYNSAISQLATHVSALQIGSNGSYIAASPHPPPPFPHYFAPTASSAGIIHTVPFTGPPVEDHPPTISSPEEYHHQTKWWYPESYSTNGILLNHSG